jgi:hypothetical protein
VNVVVPLGKSQHSLLLDANVMLLLCVGLWSRGAISRFKRTRMFTDDDFDLLAGIVSRYGEIVTTPHVLCEVSNLADFHREPERTAFFAWLVETIVPNLPEHSEPSSTLVRETAFVRLGLTDAAVQQAARSRNLHVITTDTDLWAHLLKLEVPVHNFNHLRSDRLLS